MTRSASGLLAFIFLLGSGNVVRAGDDKNDFLGTWRGPSRFGGDQAIIILKSGDNWNIQGLILTKGSPTRIFQCKDVKFHPDKSLSFQEEFGKFAPKGAEPAKVVLRIEPDKARMRVVAQLPDNKEFEAVPPHDAARCSSTTDNGQHSAPRRRTS